MTEQISQLRSLAGQVRDYQTQQGWSDARLSREVAHVGSAKTYKRILDPEDPLEGLNLPNQIRNFLAARELVMALRAKNIPAEPEYEDFTNVLTARQAVSRAFLEVEDCVARLVVIEGNTGTGKDAVRRNLEKEWPEVIISVEATELWRYSLDQMGREIYQAVKIVKQRDKETGEIPVPPRYAAGIFAEIIGDLKRKKRILLINEAHSIGPRGLNMIKTIINQTPTVVVIECVPKLLLRMIGTSFEEAVQLIGNRLCERVSLPSPPADEVTQMLESRGVKFVDAETANTAATRISALASQYGNWRFVVQCCRALFEASRKTAVNLTQLTTIISVVESKRSKLGGMAA